MSRPQSVQTYSNNKKEAVVTTPAKAAIVVNSTSAPAQPRPPFRACPAAFTTESSNGISIGNNKTGNSGPLLDALAIIAESKVVAPATPMLPNVSTVSMRPRFSICMLSKKLNMTKPTKSTASRRMKLKISLPANTWLPRTLS